MTEPHSAEPTEPTEPTETRESAGLPPAPQRQSDADLVLEAAAAVAAAAIQVGNPWLKASLLEQSAEVWRNYALVTGTPPISLAPEQSAHTALDED